MPSSGTQYIPPFGEGAAETVEANAAVAAGQSGTISNFVFNVTTSPGGPNSWTVTLRKNGASTSVTCTISGNATSCSDSTHSVSFSAGDTIDVMAVPNAGAAHATYADWHATYQ
jgi:hypothetical protein